LISLHSNLTSAGNLEFIFPLQFSVHCFLVGVKCWPPAPKQALAINQLLCPLEGSQEAWNAL